MSVKIGILGNGITGITAALRLRELVPEARITVISSESDLFFSRTALMYVYMKHVRFRDTVVHPPEFYRKHRIGLVSDAIHALDAATCKLEGENATYQFDYLLLATGSRPRLPGIPGEALEGVQGLYSKQDLEALEKWTHRNINRAVVAGGGLIGVELAEMLLSRKIPVTFAVREPQYFSAILPQAEAQMVTAEVARHCDLRLETTLQQISGNTQVTSVTTSAGEQIACSLVGLTIGVEPRKDLAEAAGIRTNRGILTDACLYTSAPRILAAGDCAEVLLPGNRRRVQQIWYTGRLQGKLAGENIAAQILGRQPVEYDPGIYFNSARFFSLDYQVYGEVPADAREETSLLWQDTAQQKLIRICYDGKKSDRPVTGFNVLGVRMKHPVCEHWLARGAPLAEVLRDLGKAAFDPEFSPAYLTRLRSIA